jgi:hypothetical protein
MRDLADEFYDEIHGPTRSERAEHLPECVGVLPSTPGCEQVRQQYGICPDHDGWCAPGCPAAEDVPA